MNVGLACENPGTKSAPRCVNSRGHGPTGRDPVSVAKPNDLVYHEPDLMRVVDRITVHPEGCWSWEGGKNQWGYSQCKFAGRTVRVHRLLFGHWRGDPGADQLHHRCENKWCVNPWHLDALTPQAHADQHLKSHCPQGHPYAGDNLYVNPQGNRECRACHRDRKRTNWRIKHGFDADAPLRTNAAKTQCVNGHEFTAENTRIRPNGNRACRACQRAAKKRYTERKRAER